MVKGYTVEVVNREARKSSFFHYGTEAEARADMVGVFHDQFAILTEWMQDGGFGDYEVELARQNW